VRALLALTLLAGCTVPPAGTFSAEPIGHSTYGTLPDGRKVRLWTDNLTGTTTGTIGGESVRLKSHLMKQP
jgi:hypothetical protein